MMGGGWYWENYKGFLESKGIRCLSPDLRFHSKGGGKIDELGKVSISDYVADLENLIKKENDLPVIVGHSMGGLIAQILVSKGLAKAGIFLTPAPPYGIMHISFSQLYTFSDVMIKPQWWKNPFKLSQKKFAYSILNMLTEDEIRNIYPNFCYESGRALFEIGLWFLDKNKASAVNFKSVSCPILLVSAKKDKITPYKLVKKIAEKYRKLSQAKVHYEELTENGHWVVGERNWKDIADLIATFILRKEVIH